VKQRFLNQKLGKRVSRKAALERAKLSARELRGAKGPAWKPKLEPPGPASP
jgi:hypothetical protein